MTFSCKQRTVGTAVGGKVTMLSSTLGNNAIIERILAF